MDKKNIRDIVPTTQKINASSPGTLALERFKLALAIGEEEGEEAQGLRNSLLDNNEDDHL